MQAKACAGVVKLVDTSDLGSDGASHGGSSPFARTIFLCGFNKKEKTNEKERRKWFAKSFCSYNQQSGF